MTDTTELLAKAERSFHAARELLKAGDVDFAASRTYYGYFYVAQALLDTLGLSFSNHGQAIAQYGRHFAKTDRLDRRYHRNLKQAFDLRQVADYTTKPMTDSDKIRQLIDEGEAFLRAARAYRQKSPTG